jgi:hypothetical protein
MRWPLGFRKKLWVEHVLEVARGDPEYSWRRRIFLIQPIQKTHGMCIGCWRRPVARREYDESIADYVKLRLSVLMSVVLPNLMFVLISMLMPVVSTILGPILCPVRLLIVMPNLKPTLMPVLSSMLRAIRLPNLKPMLFPILSSMVMPMLSPIWSPILGTMAEKLS